MSFMIGTGLFFIIGIYFILSDLLHMPTIQTTKAALKLMQGGKAHGYQAVLLRMTEGLSGHIHLSEYRRRELTATLKYAEIEQTPETYIASIIVRGLVRLLWAIPGAFLSPIIVPIVIVLTINRIMEDTRKASKIVAQKRTAIEQELPRFVATIAQEMSATRDVLSILDGYRASAGTVFKNELDMTVAAMRSGSQEQALNQLSGRVGSGMLSEVVRELLGALQGNDSTVPFEMLNHDYQKLEVQQLQKEIQKRPGKLKKYVFLLLICIMVIMIFLVSKDLMGNLGTLYS